MIRKILLYILLLLACAPVVAHVYPPAGPGDQYERALTALQNEVPLTYNETVKSFINLFITQKGRFARMAGLSEYYFPIYEKVFKDRGLPDELKYISVMESSLDPNAVSSAEATGPWQFLHEVGKKYGLTVNDSIDERRDPTMACNAAASYLLDSYEFYGKDWLLAIASYNCGRNSIKWAMEDSGGKRDYWSIRKYLPKETQSYVPIFIATVYMMNNYRQHGIVPVEPAFMTETEVIAATKKVKLETVAGISGMNPYILYNLNPAYRKQEVNGSPSSPKTIVIPILPTYTYNAICRLAGAPERIYSPQTAEQPVAKKYYAMMYRVQDGDTLATIASKFEGVSAALIKKANNLESDSVSTGDLLKILQEEK
jgi:membrane-bound lytic murein transglycosylase D